MSYSKVSDCPRCGAPIYVPAPWPSIIPPPPHYSCECYGSPGMGTATRVGNVPTVWNNNSDNLRFKVVKKDEEALEELLGKFPKTKKGEDAVTELLKQFPESGHGPSTEERLMDLEVKVNRILNILDTTRKTNKRKRVAASKKSKKLLKD